MLRLQSSPVSVIIFLIINFIIFSFSAPISEEFQEIDLPTDEITENDLARLSDSELLELERALQQKIEEFENEKNGFVEDSIPIRSGGSSNNNMDERKLLRAMAMRERRAGGRSNTVPVLNEDGAIELFPLMQDEQQPIVVFEEPVTEEEILQQQQGDGGQQYVLIPEDEAEAEVGIIPIEIQDDLEAQQFLQEQLLQQQMQQQMQEQMQPQPILLSENDIDELELRQRLADLGEQLTKRAIQGF